VSAPSDPVRATLERYAAAVRAKDVEALIALYDADVHVFDMWGQWSLRGLDAWREMARGWFGSLGEEYVVVGFDGLEAMAADGLAIGHATTTYTAYAAAGTPLRSLDNRITLVLRQRGEDWKVVHQHTSTPIEHGSLKAVLQRPQS
jgi:ketosteroid isomerase-like protein